MRLKYEVETRFCFNTKDELLDIFPILKNITFTKVIWNTTILKNELFNQDIQLRFSEVCINEKKHYYLGYKDKDIGNFCNIRKELDEEIKDFSNFYSKSIILKKILKIQNLQDKLKIKDYYEFLNYLNFLNLDKFLFFEGESELASIALSKFFSEKENKKIEKQRLNLKILYSKQIKYPILFEIELMADNEKQAFFYETLLRKVVDEYNLGSKIIRKEPPTIVYENRE